MLNFLCRCDGGIKMGHWQCYCFINVRPRLWAIILQDKTDIRAPKTGGSHYICDRIVTLKPLASLQRDPWAGIIWCDIVTPVSTWPLARDGGAETRPGHWHKPHKPHKLFWNCSCSVKIYSQFSFYLFVLLVWWIGCPPLFCVFS